MIYVVSWKKYILQYFICCLDLFHVQLVEGPCFVGILKQNLFKLFKFTKVLITWQKLYNLCTLVPDIINTFDISNYELCQVKFEIAKV